MKKIIKTCIVILIIGSFFSGQNIHGIFQFEIGDKVAYEIMRAGYDIKVSSTAERFVGCSNSGTILDNGTVIVVEVMNVTTYQLKWNTTNLSPTITSTCYNNIAEMTYINFLIDAFNFLTTGFDIYEIISSGIIDPIYFVPFEVPLFVDPKPDTWILFDSLEGTTEAAIATMAGGFTFITSDVIHAEVNNLMNLTLVLYGEDTTDIDNNIAILTITGVSYNMTTGALEEAIIFYAISGKISGVIFSVIADYRIKQTEVPPEPFNLLNFLKENKWYFIGGGAGVVAIGATIGIVVSVKKAKASRKSTKKSPSKKK